jgi:hypothetical protein
MLERNPGAPLVAAMIALTLLSVVVTRRRAFVLCSVWCAFVLVALLFAAGVADPHHVALRIVSARYWVGLAAADRDRHRRRAGRARGAAPGGRAGGRGAGGGRRDRGPIRVPRRPLRRALWRRQRRGGADRRPWSALRAWLHDHGDGIRAIASDGRTASTLDLMYRYASLGGGIEWHRAVLVANRGPRWRPRDVDGAALLWSHYTSAHAPRASDGWRLVWSSDNARLRVYVPSRGRPWWSAGAGGVHVASGFTGCEGGGVRRAP